MSHHEQARNASDTTGKAEQANGFTVPAGRLLKVAAAAADTLAAREDWERCAAAVGVGLLVQPDRADLWNRRAIAWIQGAAPRRAQVAARRALALNPADAGAAWCLAQAALMAGDLATGWRWYEAGFAIGARWPDRRHVLPPWRGEPLAGRRLLVWSEQGVGDQLLLASCLSDLLARTDACVIETIPRLVPLFARSFPGAEVRAQIYDLARADFQEVGDCDCQISLGTLPALVRRRLADFPNHAGYLVPDPERVAAWRNHLAALGPGLKVGIAWRSRANSPHNDRFHSRLDAWGPVLGIPGIHFVNLQYEDAEAELLDAEARFGVSIHRLPGVDLMNDLDEMAAVSQALDLVVATFASAAEMAGSVGTPVLMLAPTRVNYKYLGSDRLPWLPSITPFFRERWGEDWHRVLGKVAEDLKGKAA